MNIPEDNILKNPLLTEDGFLNEACLNELSSAIKNIPETHQRLSNDPEWTKKHIVHFRHISGYFAYNCVRCLTCAEMDKKNPPNQLPNFEKVLNYLQVCLARHEAFKEYDTFGNLSLCEINKLLWDILGNLKMFNDWNTNECMGENWIDLSALLHQVCISIRDAWRHEDAFNEKFNREWSEENSVNY